jgi:DNA-binding transcriptional LysR family regulator
MNLISLNLNLLLAFEALLEERNVTRAASRIGLTQPAMSNALNRLRAAFDDPLFLRAPGGVAPTARAQAMAPAIRGGLAQFRAAISESREFHPESANSSFRLAMSDYAEWALLGRLMARLQAAAPNIQIVVRRVARVFLPPEEELSSDALDAAIGFFPEPSALQLGTHSQELWAEDNVCILRRGHPLLRKKIGLRQFASAQHIANVIRPEVRGFIDDILAGHGLKRKLITATPHMLTIPSVVASSDLIAVVPRGLAQHARKSLPIQLRPVPIRMPTFHMRLVWRERNSDNPAHAWLRTQISECAAQLNLGKR